MFKVDKKEEPDFFKKFKSKNKPVSWDGYTPEIKMELKKYMLEEEQGYFCPYCELKIDLDDSQIEHIKPKSLFPKLLHEYSNYLTCCNNSKSKTCGQHKLNYWSDKFIDPAKENPEDYLTYKLSTGEIVPKEKEGLKFEKAKYTIEILNLNENRLCNLRKFLIRNKEHLDYIDGFPTLKKYLKENY